MQLNSVTRSYLRVPRLIQFCELRRWSCRWLPAPARPAARALQQALEPSPAPRGAPGPQPYRGCASHGTYSLTLSAAGPGRAGPSAQGGTKMRLVARRTHNLRFASSAGARAGQRILAFVDASIEPACHAMHGSQAAARLGAGFIGRCSPEVGGTSRPAAAPSNPRLSPPSGRLSKPECQVDSLPFMSHHHNRNYTATARTVHREEGGDEGR
jgi:hypothetical protein